MQTNPVPSEAELDALVRDTSDFLEAEIEVPEVITLQLLAAITALRKREQDRREAKCNPQAEAEKK